MKTQCPDDLDLAALVAGELPSERGQEIFRHLDECLECRLVVRAAGRAIHGVARREQCGGAGALPQGFVSDVVDETALDDAVPAGQMVLAAATTDSSRQPEIPTCFTDGGARAVTFRIDPRSRMVTAHVVPVDGGSRFRPILLDGRTYLTDANGEASLETLTPEEVLGARMDFPTPAVTWRLEPRPLSEAGFALRRLSQATGGRTAGVRARCHIAAGELTVSFEAEGEGIPGPGIIVAASNRARHMDFTPSGSSHLSLAGLEVDGLLVTLYILL